MYADTLVMMAAGLRVALGVRYKQLQGYMVRLSGKIFDSGTDLGSFDSIHIILGTT